MIWCFRCVNTVSLQAARSSSSSSRDFLNSWKGFMLDQVMIDCSSAHEAQPVGNLFGFRNLSRDPCSHLKNIFLVYLPSLSGPGSLLGPSTSSHKSQADVHGWGAERTPHRPRAAWWWGPRSTSSATRFTHSPKHREGDQLPRAQTLS